MEQDNIEREYRLGPLYMGYSRFAEDDWNICAGIQIWKSYCMEVGAGSDYCCHTRIIAELFPWPWIAFTFFHRVFHIGGTRRYKWE